MATRQKNSSMNYLFRYTKCKVKSGWCHLNRKEVAEFVNMAANMNMDLSVAKKNLSDALSSDSMKLYLQLLMSWFKSRISRSDFDHEARKLLSEDTVHLHNQFLLSILLKCQPCGSSVVKQSSSSQPTKGSPTKPSSKKRKRAPKDVKPGVEVNLLQMFVPVNPLINVQQINVEAEDKSQGFASRDMLLPDPGMVHGRMLVTAWDFGLDTVDDNSVKVVMNALENQLKNIITAVCMRQRAYKLREGRFKHAMGTQLPETHKRNATHAYDYSQESEATSISAKGLHIPAIKPSLETGQRDAAVQLACGSVTPPTRYPINLYDLCDALQVHKSVIPSHTVYATNMERILHRLWHPSHEELEQAEIHRQETALRRDLSPQHLAILRS